MPSTWQNRTAELIMNTFLLVTLLFVSMQSAANYQNNPQDINSLSTSDSYAQINEENITTLINRYSPAASSAASLALSGCSVGMSMQTDDGGVAFGSVDHICNDEKILMIAGTRMVADIASAEKEFSLAINCRESNPERYQAHLDRAYEYLMSAKDRHTKNEKLFDRMIADNEATRKTSRWASIMMDVGRIALVVALLTYGIILL